MKDSETIQATINLRKATREDLVFNKRLNVGMEYWVMNQDEKTLSGKHTITSFTDAQELNAWWKQGRAYVMVSCLDKPVLVNG